MREILDTLESFTCDHCLGTHSHCDGNDKKLVFPALHCHHGMGSAPNGDGDGNRKMGIIVIGEGVHTVMATENKKMFI